jgi:hypothetical protein
VTANEKFLFFQIYVIDKLTGAKLRTLQRHKNGIRCIHLRYPLALSGEQKLCQSAFAAGAIALAIMNI